MPRLPRLNAPGVLHLLVITGIERRKIFRDNKDRGSLLCFCPVQELGISLAELAKHLGITVSGVGYAVERGQAIARNNNYQLIEEIS